MKSKKKNRFNQRIITGFIVLSIALIAFLTYSDIIGYFFTGMDAIPLIDSSRIQSFRDVVKIFAEPGLKDFPDAFGFHKWYRPISVLSYSVDYSIWKLNPVGYHLTDLILHVLVSIFVFFLIRLLINGRQVTAWLGAFIFTTHPLLVEAIPANVRRMDTIVTLFVLLSLLLFLKYFSSGYRKQSYLIFSVSLCALAIFTKEIAIILPPLIFIYALIFYFSRDQSIMARMVQALKVSCFYFIVSIVYLAVRMYILEGIGGYANEPSGIFSIFQLRVEIIINYFISLLYPVDFLHLNSVLSLFPTMLIQFFLSVALLTVCFIGILQRNKIKEYFSRSTQGKVVGFLLIWLLMPLGVYMLTLISGRYYLYISVIPFSTILSIILVESFQYAAQRIREYHSLGSSNSSLLINSAVMRFLVIAGLSSSLLVYSPLIRTYEGWKDSGEISRMFLNELSKILLEFPNDIILHIYNFPSEIASYETRIPHAKEVEYLTDYGIKSWLDLNYPTNRVKVVLHSKTRYAIYPNNLDLEIKKEKDNNIKLIIKYESGNSM